MQAKGTVASCCADLNVMRCTESVLQTAQSAEQQYGCRESGFHFVALLFIAENPLDLQSAALWAFITSLSLACEMHLY